MLVADEDPLARHRHEAEEARVASAAAVRPSPSRTATPAGGGRVLVGRRERTDERHSCWSSPPPTPIIGPVTLAPTSTARAADVSRSSPSGSSVAASKKTTASRERVGRGHEVGALLLVVAHVGDAAVGALARARSRRPSRGSTTASPSVPRSRIGSSRLGRHDDLGDRSPARSAIAGTGGRCAARRATPAARRARRSRPCPQSARPTRSAAASAS